MKYKSVIYGLPTDHPQSVLFSASFAQLKTETAQMLEQFPKAHAVISEMEWKPLLSLEGTQHAA